MIGINIELPERDRAEVGAMVRRFVAFYRGDMGRAVEKTMVRIISALREKTKVSAKIRKIVRNPDPRAKTDARRAPFGVMKYSNKRTPREYFSPIRGTGEYGAAIRYMGRNKVLMRVRGGWEVFTRAELESMNMSSRTIQNHPKRIIGRSGLAKDSWGWMLGQLGASAALKFTPNNEAVKVTRTTTDNDVSITADNKLKYIRAALKPGAISTVMQRAKQQMMWDLASDSGRAAIRARMRAAA
jgi:hypothetical protein